MSSFSTQSFCLIVGLIAQLSEMRCDTVGFVPRVMRACEWTCAGVVAQKDFILMNMRNKSKRTVVMSLNGSANSLGARELLVSLCSLEGCFDKELRF